MPQKKKSVIKADDKVEHKNCSIQDMELDEDFVFPIYYEEGKRSVTRKIKSSKRKYKLSPHLLDLRKPIKSEPTEHIVGPENFNPENWFSNFKEAQQKYESPKKEIDFGFESPELSELAIEKIKYSKPPKEKIRSGIKLNFNQYVFQEPTTQLSKKIKQNKQLKSLSIIKKIFFYTWFAITLPFRALDFIVDRTLKGIWWLIKSIFIGIYSLFRALIVNFRILVLQPRAVKVRAINTPNNYKGFNYKSILTFALICLIIVLPLQIANWTQKNSGLKGHVLGKSLEGLEALKNASDLSQDFNFEQASEAFSQAYFNFKIAETYLENLDVVSQQIVKLIPQTAQAENLLIIGQLSARIGEGLSTLGGQLEINSGGEISLIEKLENIQSALNQLEPHFLELLNRVKEVDVQILSDQLEGDNLKKLILFQSSLSSLKQNFDNLKNINNFLLEFMGQKANKKYLVIFQNNSELRPTGGFMGSYALVEIKKGEIINMEVPGGGFYDLKAGNQTMVEAPKPFHLFSPYWQIWNANWFPDWSASAEKIAWFYENSSAGVTVDGVLSLTPDVIQDVLDMTGPIEMEDYDKTIDSENFIQEIQMAVEFEYDKEENRPKQIIADMMPIVLENIFDLKINQTPQFLQLLNNNLKYKNILLWFKDNDMQQFTENFNWDGKIKNSQSDFLMVVHTNIGGGKTDRVIDNEILHQVEINDDGEIYDIVTLIRTHNGKTGDIFGDQNNVDYVRFYVPQGSELISADGFDYLPNNLFKIATDYKTLDKDPHLQEIEKNPILDEETNMRITQEFDKTCFGNWLQVKPGQEVTASIKYKLPFKLKKYEPTFWQKIASVLKEPEQQILSYNFIIQKQAGLMSTDFTSQIQLPSNYQVTNTLSKNDLTQQNNIITYQDDLEVDGYYGVEIK